MTDKFGAAAPSFSPRCHACRGAYWCARLSICVRAEVLGWRQVRFNLYSALDQRTRRSLTEAVMSSAPETVAQKGSSCRHM